MTHGIPIWSPFIIWASNIRICSKEANNEMYQWKIISRKSTLQYFCVDLSIIRTRTTATWDNRINWARIVERARAINRGFETAACLLYMLFVRGVQKDEKKRDAPRSHPDKRRVHLRVAGATQGPQTKSCSFLAWQRARRKAINRRSECNRRYMYWNNWFSKTTTAAHFYTVVMNSPISFFRKKYF